MDIMKKFKNIYIETTTYCNLECPFCPSKSIKIREMLTLDDFKNYVLKVRDYTDGIYLHILGEPLLNHDIFEMIDYASSTLKVSMTTNGRLIGKFLEKIINSKLYILNISLQSLQNDPNLNNFIDDYFNTLNKLIKNKPESLNIHLRLWNDKEINQSFNDLVMKYIDNLGLLNYPNVCLSIDDEFDWPEEKEEYLRGKCLGGKNQLAVHVNGDVSLCCLDYKKQCVLGNLNNVVNLSELIESDRYKNVIKGFNDQKPYFKICQACKYKMRFKR